MSATNSEAKQMTIFFLGRFITQLFIQIPLHIYEARI